MTAHLKARPTVYKGIQMRSRLEAGFAGWLDENGVTWEYEPRAYASEAGQYLPDFEITGGMRFAFSRQKIFFEIKPCEPDSSDAAPHWYDLAAASDILTSCDPDARLLVVWDNKVPSGMNRYRSNMAEFSGMDVLEYGFRRGYTFDDEGLASSCIEIHWLDADVRGPWGHEWWKRQA